MTVHEQVSADDVIKQHLDERCASLEEKFEGADVVALSGGLLDGVDDLLREVVEARRAKARDRTTLVVVLTTEGGFIQVVQRIVETFRHHYDRVEFVIPNYAYSAGTILAMSGDAIHMDYYSRLGPIDPQVQTSTGQLVPALGYLAKYRKLLKKADKGRITLAEVQILLDFDQAELYKYEQARDLSITLLKRWLTAYKFKDWTKRESTGETVTDKIREGRAEEIAEALNDTGRWHSHGRGISMEVLRTELKLQIDDYASDAELNPLVKSYHGLMEDYMAKRSHSGVVHTRGMYLPYP